MNQGMVQHMQRPWGVKESSGSGEIKTENGERHRHRPCRAQGWAWTVLWNTAPPYPMLSPCAFDQLLEVLDPTGQLTGQQKALAHLQEDSHDLLAMQESSCPPPLQPMENAEFHGL